jgi:ATP-dependent RNA helicase RhlE
MSFTTLGLSPTLLKSVEKAGYTTATDIQSAAIPLMLQGKDLLASAQTGTGKTAAFGLPIIQKLEQGKSDGKRNVKVLILAPTRELAAQIQENLWTLGRFSNIRVGAFYGGVSKGPQLKNLHHGLDIVVGTPGRVLDLINTRALDLSRIDVLVLDEADQMLDMGFLPDVKTIIGFTPASRQSCMFSATMPQPIITLSKQILNNPERVMITPVEQPIDRIQQRTIRIEKFQKLSYVIHLLKDPEVQSALIFTRTKRGAKRAALNLNAQGIKTTELHGNQSQIKRNEALRNFKEKKVKVLVATDIASRGIDIHQLSHVINFDMPETPEAFLHRTGRTGRAGFSGTVFNLVSREEQGLLKDINRHTGLSLVATVDPSFVFDHTLVIKQIDEDENNSGSQRFARPKGYGKKPFSTSGNGYSRPRQEGSSEGYQGSNPRPRSSEGYQGSNPRPRSSEGYQGSNPRPRSSEGYQGSNPRPRTTEGSNTGRPSKYSRRPYGASTTSSNPEGGFATKRPSRFARKPSANKEGYSRRKSEF